MNDDDLLFMDDFMLGGGQELRDPQDTPAATTKLGGGYGSRGYQNDSASTTEPEVAKPHPNTKEDPPQQELPDPWARTQTDTKEVPPTGQALDEPTQGDGQLQRDTQTNTASPGLVSDEEVAVDLFGGVYRTGWGMNREYLTEHLRELFSDITLDQLVAILTNEYAEVLEYARLAKGIRGAAKKLSLLFNPHRLDTRTQTSKMSLFQAVREHPTFHSGLARATILRADERIQASELFWLTMQLGINGVDYVNEFPPHVAREWCVRYKLPPNAHVLDPCAGWGGRMIGVSVVADNYTCYEPATRTAAGLERLAKFINRMRAGEFHAEVNCQPYEDSSVRESFYDLAITSPPYYDSEVYSDEETNSLNRYSTFDEWCEGFYLPLIDKTMLQLKPGAPFIFNIGDRRWPLTERMKAHCAERGYHVKRSDGDIVNSAGFGRQKDAGEKFFVLTT